MAYCREEGEVLFVFVCSRSRFCVFRITYTRDLRSCFDLAAALEKR